MNEDGSTTGTCSGSGWGQVHQEAPLPFLFVRRRQDRHGHGSVAPATLT